MYAWLNAATTSPAHDAPATAITQRVRNANNYIELLVYFIFESTAARSRLIPQTEEGIAGEWKAYIQAKYIKKRRVSMEKGIMDRFAGVLGSILVLTALVILAVCVQPVSAASKKITFLVSNV